MAHQGKNASAIWHTKKCHGPYCARRRFLFIYSRPPPPLPPLPPPRRLALFPITLEALGARSQKSLAAAISSILFSANLFQLELKKSIIEARALSLFLSQQRSHPMQIQWLLSKWKIMMCSAHGMCLKRDVPNFAAQKRPTQSGFTQTGDEK